MLIAHLFILEVRQRLKKTGEPALTLPQAQRLIIAALSGDEKAVKKALKDITYIMKHNLSAYQSHRKSRLHLLE